MSATGKATRLTCGAVSVDILAGTGCGAPFTLLDYRGPGAFTPARRHRHLQAAEWFMVREGTIHCWIEGATHVLTPGRFAVAHPGEAHAWFNASPEPFRMLILFSNGGFDSYFARLFDILNDPGLSGAEIGHRIGRLAGDFDTIMTEEEDEHESE